MCNHVSSTVVSVGLVACHQCDTCGALLTWREPGEVMPLAFDEDAYAAWLRRAVDGSKRAWQRLETMQMNNPLAYKAEVRRLLDLTWPPVDATTKRDGHGNRDA